MSTEPQLDQELPDTVAPSEPEPDQPATLGELFSIPNFTKYWLGQVVSYLGDRIDGVAMGALLGAAIASLKLSAETARSQQAGAATMVPAILILPSLLLGPFVGAIVDRFDRRTLMVAMDAFRALVILAVVLCLNDKSHPGVLYAMVFLIGCGTAVFAPAKGAFLPEIVPRHLIHRANSVSSMMGSLMTAVGTPIGAYLVSHSWRTALWADAASYVASMLLLLWIVPSRLATQQAQAREATLASEGGGPGAYLRDIRDAFRHIRRHRLPGAGVMMDSTFYFMVGLAFTGINGIVYRLTPPATEVGATGGDSAKAAVISAWILGCLGVGLFIGGAAAGRLAAKIPVRVTILSSMLGVTTILTLAAFPWTLVTTCVLAFILGLFGGPTVVTVETVFQKSLPDLFRGRVLALNLMSLNFFLILTMGVAGMLFEKQMVTTGNIMSAGAVVAFLGGIAGFLAFPAGVSVRTIKEDAVDA